MTQWGWAIASAVLVITLVQIVAFYYLLRNDDGRLSWPSSTGDGASGRSAGLASADADDRDAPTVTDDREDVTRCSRCGSPNRNDPMFKFCRNCGEEL
jgi:ribosomal protein S14